ncbi:hypothetical protein LCGC14_2682130 [marine sediment metagenome]|uniref:Uncharacterized protein n=1 Tax=marine sediment metagenome TaxID=412755 RepID=A0A0F9CCS8_9ZZZZ
MTDLRICIDCGKEYGLKDDAPHKFSRCVFCQLKYQLRRMEKSHE